jgi:hypothetical protein
MRYFLNPIKEFSERYQEMCVSEMIYRAVLRKLIWLSVLSVVVKPNFSGEDSYIT